MKLDFKKIEKHYYPTNTKPSIIKIEKMNFISFNGYGNPSSDESNFKEGISLLYSTAYTISMSYKSDYNIKNFQNFVVAPLEGYWWQEGINGYDNTRKDLFKFILLIRLPDFIKEEDFNWAINKVSNKNNKSYEEVKFISIEEGLVVQCLHIGSYDSEVITTKIMHEYINENGYELDFSDKRNHHEIYLSDARKTDVNKLKTILRHPIKIKVK